LFSNCMEYEKPEQPPPTTPTRRPAGTGFCCAIISLTLAIALGVSVMGGAFTSGVVVVVDIRISLSLLGYIITNPAFSLKKPGSGLALFDDAMECLVASRKEAGLPSRNGTIICLGPIPFPSPICLWSRNRGPNSEPRWPMSPLIVLLIAWGVLTAILVVLLIYRSTLTMQEDDQLYLSESESHMQKEQTEILAKVNRLTPAVRWLGAASGLLILVIAGMAIYQGLNAPQ